MSNLTIAATFTKNAGEPATGLVLADIDFYLTRQNRSTGVDEVIWDGTQHPTEEIDNIGSYARIYTDADFDTYVYFARASYTGAVVLDISHVTGGDQGVSPWEYGIRRLTQAAASIAEVIEGVDITAKRGDSMSVPLTGLGDLTNYISLDWMVKELTSDEDEDSIIWIRKNLSGVDDGLLRFNKEAELDPTLGSITIDDILVGNITIALDESRTVDLEVRRTMHWDQQIITAIDVITITEGEFDVTADVVRAIV